METLAEAREFLQQAIAQYGAARSLAAVETAILAMHTGLEVAFRAYLRDSLDLPSSTREALAAPGGVSFPDLVDLMAEYSHVLGADPGTPALLVSLNTTRVRIAHPIDKPPPRQIVHDARRLAELINTLWLRLFPGTVPPRVKPVTTDALTEGAGRQEVRPEPGERASPTPRRLTRPVQEQVEPAPERPSRLLSLWRGEKKPSRWFLKLLGGTVFTLLAGPVWDTAVGLARWEPPLKTAGLVLAFIAAALAARGVWLLGRVFLLVGARRVLIALVLLFVLAVGVRVLISEGSQSLGQEVVFQTQVTFWDAWQALAGFGRSVLEAPSTFKFAYTGRRPPASIPVWR